MPDMVLSNICVSMIIAVVMWFVVAAIAKQFVPTSVAVYGSCVLLGVAILFALWWTNPAVPPIPYPPEK